MAGSAHLCPTFSQVLAPETLIGVTGVVSNIFTLLSLNLVTNIQIKGVSYFRNKSVDSYRKDSFCSQDETSKRRNHMKRALGCTESEAGMSAPVGICLWGKLIFLCLHSARAPAGRSQGCRMFLHIHHFSQRWEGPWRRPGMQIHGWAQSRCPTASKQGTNCSASHGSRGGRLWFVLSCQSSADI